MCDDWHELVSLMCRGSAMFDVWLVSIDSINPIQKDLGWEKGDRQIPPRKIPSVRFHPGCFPPENSTPTKPGFAKYTVDANLFPLESSILTWAKRATNWNNGATNRKKTFGFFGGKHSLGEYTGVERSGERLGLGNVWDFGVYIWNYLSAISSIELQKSNPRDRYWQKLTVRFYCKSQESNRIFSPVIRTCLFHNISNLVKIYVI